MERNEQIQAVILSAFQNYGNPNSRVDELSHDLVLDGEPMITNQERDDAYFKAMHQWVAQKRS